MISVQKSNFQSAVIFLNEQLLSSTLFNKRLQRKVRLRSSLLTGEVKAGCRQRAKQELGHVPLSGSVGGVLWGFWTKAELISSAQKEQRC